MTYGVEGLLSRLLVNINRSIDEGFCMTSRRHVKSQARKTCVEVRHTERNNVVGGIQITRIYICATLKRSAGYEVVCPFNTVLEASALEPRGGLNLMIAT